MLSQSDLVAVVKKIIEKQQTIVGPLAIEQANMVQGVEVDEFTLNISTNGNDSLTILTQLVEKYEELFGKTSIEVCKDAVKELHADISLKDLPAILQ